MTAAWKPPRRTSGRFLSPEIVEQTGSTNADLIERARAGAPAGDVLIARHQTAGRGRQGRTWFDRPGSSLLMSWSIDIDPVKAPLVSLVAGTAVVETIDAVVGQPTAALKWPNDVLIPGRGERKITGILAEAVHRTPQLRVVVGMGTNLDLGLDEEDVPSEVRRRAIDLRSLVDGPVDPAALVDRLLDACERRVDELETSTTAALVAYRSRCVTIGRAVQFETPTGLLEGVATAVADDGALMLRTADGTVHRLTAGDAHHIR